MFAKQGNKTLRDQVEDLAERIQPHVENAIEQITPVLEDARDRAGAAAGDARDKAAPYVSDARDKFVKDVVPAVTAAVAAAGEKAEPYAEEARRRGRATAAAVKGEVDAPKKGSKVKKLVVFGALAALGAFLYKMLKGDDSSTAWQSSYQPAPAPTPPTPAPPAPARPPSALDDASGASPDEAVADAVAGEKMHDGHHAGLARRGDRRQRRARPEGPEGLTAQACCRVRELCAGGRSVGRCSSTQSSIRSHQSKSHSIWSSRPVGISSRGTRHQPMLICLSIGRECHTSRSVSTWSIPVCATSRTSASGAASSAASRPPGFGASTCFIRSARRAIRSMPSRRSRVIARARRFGVKLPPSGKITNASFSSRLRARSAICGLHVLPDARVGPDEPARQPVQQDADGRVPGEGVLEHDARLPAVPVHERVHQQERVARTGVPAAHQQRLARERRR